MGEQFNFTVGGQGFSISREEIERKLKGVRPEQIRQYYVTVNRKDYPVKQASEVWLYDSRCNPGPKKIRITSA